jgi:hypothetical protein
VGGAEDSDVLSPEELDAALCSFGAALDAALAAALAVLAAGSQSQEGVELESVPRMKVLAPASYLSAQVVSASKVPLGLGAGAAAGPLEDIDELMKRYR